MRLALVSHFNITKVFDDHILFVWLPYIGQSSFTFIQHEQAFFSFRISVVSLLQFLVLSIIAMLLYYGKLKKKKKKKKNREKIGIK